MIQVDHTLPPKQFNAELLAASRMHRLFVRIRRARLAHTEAAFKSLGWDEKAARELAEIHVARLA